MKKLLWILAGLIFFSVPVAWAIQRGGAGADNEETYVCGSGEKNSLGSTSINTDSFVSGPLGKGWRILSDGSAEFQDITARGIIRTSVFEKDTISAVNGLIMVSSADVLDADMTALDASTLTISGETTFSANEVLRIKDGTDDEWLLVTNAGSAPTYTVTRDLAADYTADTNPIWTKGTAVVSMGVGTGSKTGFITLDSSSANSPFIDIYARNSNTYSDYSLKARLGWLQGIIDSDVGLDSTDVWGLYSDSVYLKGTVVAASGEIGGWTLGTYEIKDTAGTTGMNCNVTGGDDVRFWAGNATPASAPFRVTEAGALTATSGTIGGFTLSSTTLANGTDIVFDASNKAISVNNTTFGNAGIQLQYNGGTPRFYVGDGSNKYINYDGTNLNISVDANVGTGVGIIYKNGSRWLYDFNPAHNGSVQPEGYNAFLGVACGNLTMGSTATLVTESSYNYGMGYQCLYSNTKGSQNSAIGYQALYDNTTGYGNIAIGYRGLYENTIGYGNVAVGINALVTNTEGDYNVGIGTSALYKNTTGGSNIALGYQTMNENTGGDNNVALGKYALRSNTTASINTATGVSALYYNTEGQYNAGFGSAGLQGNTTGSYNTGAGYEAGAYQNDGTNWLQTPEYSVYLGANTKSGSDPSGGEDAITNEIVIGYNAIGNGSNTATLGNTSISALHCQVDLTVDSDERIKKNVTDIPVGLNFINSLTPITYQRIKALDWPKEIRPAGVEDAKEDDRTYLGLIAQDVEKVLVENGLDWEVVKTASNGKKSITYGSLIIPLIKAVQELSARVKELEAR